MYNRADQAAAWWISIGIGITVVLCVVVLLSLVTAFVNDIDRHVTVVVAELDHLFDNTATAPDLHEAASLIGALGSELEAHVQSLEEGTGYL
jgi:predicted RecB family endonuclease